MEGDIEGDIEGEGLLEPGLLETPPLNEPRDPSRLSMPTGDWERDDLAGLMQILHMHGDETESIPIINSAC